MLGITLARRLETYRAFGVDRPRESFERPKVVTVLTPASTPGDEGRELPSRRHEKWPATLLPGRPGNQKVGAGSPRSGRANK